MRIVLSPGEQISVCFSETDGEVVVEFGINSIKVTADLPDNEGRTGIIYEDVFPTEEVKTEV